MSTVHYLGNLGIYHYDVIIDKDIPKNSRKLMPLEGKFSNFV